MFCQLENLVYYNRLKHSKIVISDFHLAKLENGLIKEPCGTPEYLGKTLWEFGSYEKRYLNVYRKKAFKIICLAVYLILVTIIFFQLQR